MKNTQLKFDVIFDNGGGITFQTESFCHFYYDPTDAATDVHAFMADGSTDGWDGNEPESRLEYDSNISYNGGYKWLDQDEIAEGPDSDGWHNVDTFFYCLEQLRKS